MTRRIVSPAPGILLGLSLLLALVAATLLAPAASAAKVQANLRVVTWQGKVLFDGNARTGTMSIKPNSDCLGGSAGAARTVSGPTALGLLVAASKKSKALRPLKLSDGDFGFGICGIASAAAKGNEWWVLRQNYRDSTTGAELTKVKRNDSILLYLSKTWEEPTPDALFLKAPAAIKRGGYARVRVFSYAGSGKRKPVEGAKVSGSDRMTNSAGFTRVKVSRRTRTIARLSGFIPSNRTVIKVKPARRR